MKMAIVTATTDPFKSVEFWRTWRTGNNIPLVLVVNGYGTPPHEQGSLLMDLEAETDIREYDIVHVNDGYLGTVPAFAAGYQIAQDKGAEIICCFHDDLRIDAPLWDVQVEKHFKDQPESVLAGFGGAMGVGREGMYVDPFDPMSLARHSFGSDMQNAEAHGERWKEARRVAVLDGFSLIFRSKTQAGNPFQYLANLGVVHHAYDVALGAQVQRGGMQTWFLPIPCHHAGGRTAVADQGYHEWAKTKNHDGDHGFWMDAHSIVYEEFRDVLPFSIT